MVLRAPFIAISGWAHLMIRDILCRSVVQLSLRSPSVVSERQVLDGVLVVILVQARSAPPSLSVLSLYSSAKQLPAQITDFGG